MQTDRQDKCALGWDHQEKLQLHESQRGESQRQVRHGPARAWGGPKGAVFSPSLCGGVVSSSLSGGPPLPGSEEAGVSPPLPAGRRWEGRVRACLGGQARLGAPGVQPQGRRAPACDLSAVEWAAVPESRHFLCPECLPSERNPPRQSSVTQTGPRLQPSVRSGAGDAPRGAEWNVSLPSHAQRRVLWPAARAGPQSSLHARSGLAASLRVRLPARPQEPAGAPDAELVREPCGRTCGSWQSGGGLGCPQPCRAASQSRLSDPGLARAPTALTTLFLSVSPTVRL